MSEESDIFDFSPLYTKYENAKFRNENPLAFQHPCSVLITAGSGQGKSNLLLNCLTHPKLKMTYDEVYLCVPSLDEPCYQFLRDYFDGRREVVLKQLKKQNPKLKLTIDDIPQVFYHISNPNDIPVPAIGSEIENDEPKKKGPKSAKPATGPTSVSLMQPPVDNTPAHKYILQNNDKQKIVIIDDFTGNKIANDRIVRLCQKNRKVNTTLIVLNHDLYKLETTFKKNLSNGYVCLYQASTKRLINQFCQEFAIGISKEDFYSIFNEATKEPYSFLCIDFKTKDPRYRFRKKLHKLNLIALAENPTEPIEDDVKSKLLEVLKKLNEEN